MQYVIVSIVLCSENYPERHSKPYQSANELENFITQKKKKNWKSPRVPYTLVVRALRTPEPRYGRFLN